MSSPDPMGYNLQVLTSIPDLEVKERIDAFLQSLALQFGSELEGVKYEAHDKIECSKLLLNLSFQHNDDSLVEAFCTAVINPECDILLCSISPYGLLAFSPTDGSNIRDTWNMVLLKVIYVCGAESMEKPQRKALSLTSIEMIPTWLEVATVVAGTAIENFFSINPALSKLDLEGTEAMLRSRDSAKNKARIAGNWTREIAENVLTRLTKSKSQNLSDEDKQRAAFSSLKQFFLALDQITRTLKKIISMYSRIPAPCTLLLERLIKQVSTLIILSSEMGSIDLEHQRIVFVEMYQVTVHASTAFTANEKILEVYFKWAVKNSISALGHGLAAIVHLRDLSAYGAAHANALTLSKAATEAALALPRDTIWKQIGRSLNIVKSPPPEILKEQLLTQAGKLGNDASKLAGQRMMSGALTAITIGFFVYDVWQIVSVNDKMTYTNAVLGLLMRTWMCATEVNTLIRYIHVSGDKFEFEADGGRSWEDFLKKRLKREPENAWKSPEFVQAYLKDRWIYLDAVKTELEEKLTKLYLED